jgi:hypothetical protein
VYGIPHRATSVLRIDPQTDSVSTLGNVAGGSGLPVQWHGYVRRPLTL